MVNAKRYLLILLLASVANAQAKLTASVDRKEVYEGEVITLTVSTDKSSIFGQPDFTAVDHDFKRLSGISTQSSMSFINGKKSASVKWTIDLLPRSAGALVIPPITFDGEETRPVVINVKKGTGGSVSFDKGELVKVTLSADKTNVHVQEEVILTIKAVINNNRVKSYEIGELAYPGTQIETLGPAAVYEKYQDNGSYIVVEQKIALYPQTSGTMTLDPVEFTANFTSTTKRGFFAMDRLIPVTATSNSLKLEVSTIPPENQGKFWLPLKSFSANEKWNIPDNLEAGEPVTRTVTITGKGTTEAGMPSFSQPENDQIKSYPEQANVSENKDDNGITASKTQSFAIIPTGSGEITIPAITFQWWNTAKDRLETRTLPEKTITVAAGAGAIESPGETKEMTETSETAVPALFYRENPWFYATIAVSVLWLLTLVLLFKRPAARQSKGKQQDKPGQTSPGSAKAAKVLLASVKKGSPVQIRDDLVAWARSLFNEKTITSLRDVRSVTGDTGLNRHIACIEAMLYNNGDDTLDRDAMAEEIKKYSVPEQGPEQSNLPGLYPTR